MLIWFLVKRVGGGGSADNADTVDGFHAESMPNANTLLPLDVNARFPTDVYPLALLATGERMLEADLPVRSLVTIDGVDLSVFKSEYDLHDEQTALEAHASLGTAILSWERLDRRGHPQPGRSNHESGYAWWLVCILNKFC